MKFNKLVRDKIPDLITQNGETAIIRILEDAEYLSFLESKLDEEVSEYHTSNDIEELADILEVIWALGEVHGYSIDEMIKIGQQKKAERGGFSKKILLIEKI